MRVSGRRQDQDYWPLHYRRCPAVFLNGALMNWVIAADDEAGVVEVYANDERGLQYDEAREAFVVLQLSGRVEIVGPRRGEAIN